jgi:hypothetical protein
VVGGVWETLTLEARRDEARGDVKWLMGEQKTKVKVKFVMSGSLAGLH